MGEAVALPLICQELIGRADLLAILQQSVEQTKQGKGQVVLISGEAGIGKTRLMAEVKSYAIKQGLLPLQGHCFPTDHTYPYAPLLDLLRTLFTSPPSEAYVTAVKILAQNIYPLLPEMVDEQEVQLPHLEPEQEKHRLFALLLKFFLNLTIQQPMLLVIEDVHWCDDTSLDFLHSLARRAAPHPLLLLVTYRDDETSPALRDWLAQLERERLAQEISLTALSRDNVADMLTAIFPQQRTALDMRRFLHEELLAAMYALTEGNPFFVEETLNALMTSGDIFYAQGYWNRQTFGELHIPRSIQDAVQRRAERLSEEAHYVLTLAAVAGKQFDFVLLQQLTHYDEDHLLKLLKELVAAQLVVEAAADQFAFRHALTRRAIYTQLLGRERVKFHRMIAKTLEFLSASSSDAHLEELAYHFYQAGAWEKTVDYAQRAGEKALRLYAHRAAIDYFTWVLQAVDHLSQAPRTEVYRARGQAYETLGEFEQARQDYIQALEVARTTNKRESEWQSAIDLGFLWAGRDYVQAELWFRQALTLSQSLNDLTLQAHSLNRIGNWHLNVEQPHEALRYHREALAIFQGLQDARGTAETLDLLGMSSYLGGDLLMGTDYYQQVVPRFREMEDKSGLTSSLATLALRGPNYQTDALVAAAGLAEACQDGEQAVAIARQIGRRSDEAYALLQVGLCLGSQGEYGRALEIMRQSLQIAEEIEHRQWQTAAHTVLGGIYNGLLAYAQARAHFEQALVLAREMGSLFWACIASGYLASTAILMHDLAQAEQLLHTALRPDMPAETMAQRMVWCAAVELALAEGQPGQALEIIERLMVSLAHGAEEKNSLRVLKLRGEALAASQRPEEAEVALRAAQALARELGVRPRQWQICIEIGKLYQAQRRTAEAEQVFLTARTLIEELAVTIVDEPLRNNFLQCGLAMLPRARPLSAKQAVKQAYGGLTAREREIAVLIVQEKTNREIADMLVLSERTIETHVSNIMLKLGFSSRHQIAKWVSEKR